MTTPSLSSDSPDLLMRLRHATFKTHEALDGRIDHDEICRSQDGYSDYLERFLLATEETLRGVDWDAATRWGLPDGAARRLRYEHLRRDLAELGRIVPDKTGQSPRTEAGMRGLGALYVLEGSIHGGEILLRKLQQAGNGGLPSRFLSGFGDDNLAMWRRFAAWLSCLGDPFRSDPDVIAGAITAFESFDYQLFSAPAGGLLNRVR